MSTTKVKEADARTATDQLTDPSRTIITAAPSTKPVQFWLLGTLLGGVLVVGTAFTNPGLFGGVRTAEIVANISLLLTAIIHIRLLIKFYILTRTQYHVTPTGVRREYTLLYRTWSRELPLVKIRSHEMSRSRIETFLGIGTLNFFSGGIAGSIGHLRFDYISNPDDVRAAVHRQLSEVHVSENVGD